MGFDVSRDGKYLYVTSRRHLFLSTDYGTSWEVVSSVTATAAIRQYFGPPKVSSNGEFVYVPMAYHANSQYQMWRSKDFGKTFHKLSRKSLEIFNQLTLSGDGKTLISKTGNVPHISTDYGETFTENTAYHNIYQENKKATPKKHLYVKDIACSHNGQVLALVSSVLVEPSSYTTVMYTSTNGGASWSKKTPPNMDNYGGIFNAEFCGNNNQNIAIASRDYRKATNGKPGSQGIAVSANFGDTWTVIPKTGLASYRGLACPDDGSMIIATTAYTDGSNPYSKGVGGYIEKVKFG